MLWKYKSEKFNITEINKKPATNNGLASLHL
jgi:hypothetical protein